MKLTGLTGFGGRRRAAGRASGEHLKNGLVAHWTGYASGDTNTTETDRVDEHTNSIDLEEAGTGTGAVSNYYVSAWTKQVCSMSTTIDHLENVSSTSFRPGSNDFTVSLWLGSTNGNNYRHAICNWGLSGSYCWRIWKDGVDDKMRLAVSTDGTTTNSAEVISTITIGSTHVHCIAGRRGNIIWIQVSGETEVTTSFTGTCYDGGYLRVGHSDTSTVNANNWAGRLGYLGYWSDALNSTEISALYNSGSGPITYSSFST